MKLIKQIYYSVTRGAVPGCGATELLCPDCSNATALKMNSSQHAKESVAVSCAVSRGTQVGNKQVEPV